MTLFEIFFSALFFENVVTWYILGVSALTLFSYTFDEAILVSVRVTFIMFFQMIVLLFFKQFFSAMSMQIVLLMILVCTGIVFSILMDTILPLSHLEDSISGFIRRGDTWIPYITAIILNKQYSLTGTIAYSFGATLGFVSLFLIFTAIEINFKLYRLHPRHRYVIKLLLLGVLSLLNY